MDKNYYIRDCEVIERIGNRLIVLYGIGEDGRRFFGKYNNVLNIDFIIDQNDIGLYEGKKVKSIEKSIDFIRNRIVIVCSSKHTEEICKKLDEIGIEGGIDYFVWLKDYDSNVDELVKHNFRRWKTQNNSNNRVIIPVEDSLDEMPIMYSYLANHLSEKYCAKISAFIRRGGTRFEPTSIETIKEIYESFGVKDFLKPIEGDKRREIEAIYSKVLDSIMTLEDWNNIEIYGKNWGKSIIRDYLRFYDLSMDPRSNERKECLYNAVKSIVYWKDYFDKFSVKAVILWDGVHNESYLREISLMNGVPTYIIHSLGVQKAFDDFNFGERYKYYNVFFAKLDEQQQKVGIEWAKRTLHKMIYNKEEAYAPYRGNNLVNIFQQSEEGEYIEKNDRLKVVMCPHIFEEDSLNNGTQICNNDFISWFRTLGELSKVTNYDWYIKIHPDESNRGIAFIDEYVKTYPKIKIIPAKVSPIYLKNSGVRYAFTIAGSIGHEYPLLGINVVNAGNNPHIAYDFNINPKDVSELERIIKALENYSALNNINQIYEYYCVAYLYLASFDLSKELRKIFMYSKEKKLKYSEYLANYTQDFDKKIVKDIEKLFKKVDAMNPKGLFLKSNEEINDILDR